MFYMFDFFGFGFVMFFLWEVGMEVVWVIFDGFFVEFGNMIGDFNGYFYVFSFVCLYFISKRMVVCRYFMCGIRFVLMEVGFIY